MRFFALILPLVTIAISASAETKDLRELVSGDHPEKAAVLGADSYVPLKMKKLAHGGVLFVDLDWLREKGFAVPKEGLTPEFEKKVLDVLGWAAPSEGEPSGTYTNETATAFADRYGGFGIGFPGAQNGGSGRAASRGLLQCKGCGRTELVHPSIDVYHSSGTAALDEGIAEVVASQVAHRELPFGANRVVALISTGTVTSIDGGRSHNPRVLIYREDPLRPAHFMANETAAITETETENKRMSFVTRQLVDALPQKPGAQFQTEADRLRAGTIEMIERLADVLAFSYARGFHHGAITPSNMELDGKAIDFGTFTQYQGYPKGVSVEWIGPFGDNTSVEWFLRDFVRDLKPWLTPDQQAGLLTLKQAQRVFDSTYEHRLHFHMALLSGFPDELAAEVSPRLIDTFGETLLTLARAGNEVMIKTLWKDPGLTGTYHLPTILTSMANAAVGSKTAATLQSALDEAALKAGVADSALRARLVLDYARVLRAVEQSANQHSIASASVRKYMTLASKIRNHKIRELSRGADFWTVYEPLIEAFDRDLRPEPIRDTLMRQLESSRRSYRDAKPFTLVLDEGRAGEATWRDVFDLKTGNLSREIGKNVQSNAEKNETVASKLQSSNRRRSLPSKLSHAPIFLDLFVAR